MQKVKEFRDQGFEIIQGRSSKKVLVVGPCSIHDPSETLEYAKKLKQRSVSVEDKLFIVMRVFLEKPRTSHDWKGFIYDPFLNGTCQLEKGIKASIDLLEDLQKLELPLATEFIDPNLAPLIAPYISWGFIGARTMRSPIHRQLAAFLTMPVGFKNPLDGDLEALDSAIKVASLSHTALIPTEDLTLKIKTTSGNPYCHGVLRGSKNGPNYKLALNLSEKLLIDCAHGNSLKTLMGMEKAFYESLDICTTSSHVMGLMLESFLEEGKQSVIHPLKKGVSITDPCLNFIKTKKLILDFYKLLSHSQRSFSSSIESSFKSTSSSEMVIRGA